MRGRPAVCGATAARAATLGDEDVRQLLSRFRAGTAKRVLAERYGSQRGQRQAADTQASFDNDHELPSKTASESLAIKDGLQD
jgi:hypothetical protein